MTGIFVIMKSRIDTRDLAPTMQKILHGRIYSLWICRLSRILSKTHVIIVMDMPWERGGFGGHVRDVLHFTSNVVRYHPGFLQVVDDFGFSEDPRGPTAVRQRAFVVWVIRLGVGPCSRHDDWYFSLMLRANLHVLELRLTCARDQHLSLGDFKSRSLKRIKR